MNTIMIIELNVARSRFGGQCMPVTSVLVKNGWNIVKGFIQLPTVDVLYNLNEAAIWNMHEVATWNMHEVQIVVDKSVE